MAKRRKSKPQAKVKVPPIASVGALLTAQFPAKHVGPAVSHFTNAVADFGQGDWEESIAKAGKFVEAMLKAVATHCGITFETGRKFKADKLMNDLAQLSHGSFDDALRLLIPRACRVIYDIASNRGARHDPDEVNPNSMDANVVMPLASWILGEAIRYSQKGAVDPSEAELIVESLAQRRYPVIENIDGRLYLHAANKSAVEVALVMLAHQHPKRISREGLIAGVRRNGFSTNNAQTAITRISKFLDEDDNGGYRLLQPGLQRAEEIIRTALKG